jgi:phosphoribosylanthranilate isomerase
VTLVKICGITGPADARRASELGAWALGLIFWPQSPRACSIGAAEEIAAELRRQVELVGVFVNAPLEEVALTADRAALSILQLHGDEGPAYCQEIARRTGCRVMKAARVHSAAQVRALQPFHTDLHLLDAYSPKAPGGTGASFDWALARLHGRIPPVVLSGGLTPENVGEAIAEAGPFAVDTASGTESAPGRKDLDKLVAFFEAVVAADELAAPAVEEPEPDEPSDTLLPTLADVPSDP